jgi:hypothetical protein
VSSSRVSTVRLRTAAVRSDGRTASSVLAAPDRGLGRSPPAAPVTVSGDAGTPLRSGSWITLESFAFAARHAVNGVPAIQTKVFANGTYRATTNIRTRIKRTDYAIDASYKGKSLGPIVWLNVR